MLGRWLSRWSAGRSVVALPVFPAPWPGLRPEGVAVDPVGLDWLLAGALLDPPVVAPSVPPRFIHPESVSNIAAEAAPSSLIIMMSSLDKLVSRCKPCAGGVR
jgi:hypothetical protein